VDITAPAAALIQRRYTLLSPADIDLGYAGRQPAADPLHTRLAALTTGDVLSLRQDGDRILLCDRQDAPVGRLSRRAAALWLPRLPAVEAARIIALMRRRRDDGEGAYRDTCRVETWEYPLVELIWRMGDDDRNLVAPSGNQAANQAS
jgi:ATP-dependent DNA helicase RecQ